MSSPMLSITDSTTPGTSLPSLLPCRIQHDGQIDQAAAYWAPLTTKGAAKESYFRGKKLKGTEVSLPEEYEGLVLQPMPQSQTMNKGMLSAVPPKDEENEGSIATHSLQILSKFDRIVLWTQDFSGGDSVDLYARSLDEWLNTANQIHTH